MLHAARLARTHAPHAGSSRLTLCWDASTLPIIAKRDLVRRQQKCLLSTQASTAEKSKSDRPPSKVRIRGKKRGLKGLCLGTHLATLASRLKSIGLARKANAFNSLPGIARNVLGSAQSSDKGGANRSNEHSETSKQDVANLVERSRTAMKRRSRRSRAERNVKRIEMSNRAVAKHKSEKPDLDADLEAAVQDQGTARGNEAEPSSVSLESVVTNGGERNISFSKPASRKTSRFSSTASIKNVKIPSKTIPLSRKAAAKARKFITQDMRTKAGHKSEKPDLDADLEADAQDQGTAKGNEAEPSSVSLESVISNVGKRDVSFSKPASSKTSSFSSAASSKTAKIPPKTILLTGEAAAKARTIMPQDRETTAGHEHAKTYLREQDVPLIGSPDYVKWLEEDRWHTCTGGVMSSKKLSVKEVKGLRKMDVPTLAHGIDRVLFNPTLFWLREPRTGIYNFDPRIRNLYDVDLFDYKSLPAYLTSSVDPELTELASKYDKKYRGSTSSMTGLLSQIYFCISGQKGPELSGFSEGFEKLPKGFSFGAKLPASIVLRRFEEKVGFGDNEGTSVRYAIDNDKSASGELENSNYVLTQLGKSVEKLLTSGVEEYEKYLRVNSNQLTEEEKTRKEAYYYSQSDKFLMRSQLDCSDDRLPRKTFDLKTRSVIAVRQDRANWVESSGYMIRHARGVNESFEREIWDMSRSAFLKYYFQARIGNMDGILVAFHSTSTVYGFQYLPLEEMNMQLFGSSEMGEQAFLLCVGMLEKILDAIVERYPNDSLRITFDGINSREGKLIVFAQPDNCDPADETREKRLLQFDVEVDRYLSGKLVQGPVDFHAPAGYRIFANTEDEIARRKRAKLPPLEWSLEYGIRPRSDLDVETTAKMLGRTRNLQMQFAPLTMPNVSAINEREAEREAALAQNKEALEGYFRDRASGQAMGMPRAPGQIALGASLRSAAATAGDDATEENASVTYTVSIDDGDTIAAQADLAEKTCDTSEGPAAELEEESERANPESSSSSAQQAVRWVTASRIQGHLRELARLGREDKERLDKTDPLRMYQDRRSS